MPTAEQGGLTKAVRESEGDALLKKSKYEIVSDILREKVDQDGSLRVLDVGCRDCVLKMYLPADASYAGVDLFQNDEGTVDYVQDLTAGLPFPDQTWSAVTALDVIEHVDDMDHALNELWRVTGGRLIVVLPNMAHLGFRLAFLRSGHLGTTKYDLSYPGNLDRHRWFTTQKQSDAYMSTFARSVEAQIKIIHTAECSSRAALAKLCKAVGIGPQFWSWASIYVLDRQSELLVPTFKANAGAEPALAGAG